ncbi:MAG: hypothetical protein ATN31_07115 [Candidatus Epulonipiscioides saccharophilum]|nr:MAG: hypothetical protein ATN31_07115 [Epulopiscium sp. AS2M-Bin001]
MSKFSKYKFNELYDMSSGISTSKAQAGHGYPFISFSTVFNNIFLPLVIDDLMDTSEKQRLTYSIKKDDILITRTSETIDELAMSSVALQDYHNTTYSGFTKRLRPKTNTMQLVYSKYLAFYLRSCLFRKAVNNNAFMTLRASFNEDIFSFLELTLPEYSQQIKIGDLLFVIEQKIQNNKKIISQLEDMVKTIYDYWFTQFDFPDENGKPYKSSGGKMVYNEDLKRKIPVGWEVGNFKNYILDIKNGDWGKDNNIGNYTNEVICIRGADFYTIKGKNQTIPPTRFINKNSSHKLLKTGDILVEISGGSPTQSTGRICYINDITLKRFNKNIITSNFCRGLTLKNLSYLYWFYLCWDNIYNANILFGYESKTTGIKNLMFDIFAETYKIINPAENIINDFYQIVSPMFDNIQRINIENQELTSLRDWLLPMLMNGQARVE